MSNVQGTDALLRRLDAIKTKSGRTMLQQIQLEAVRNAKFNARRFTKTGRLERSIEKGTLADDYCIVKATAGHAAYVELGTRPHKIPVGSKGFLAWPEKGTPVRLTGKATRGANRAGGNYVYTRRAVNHPGTKAQPYLVPAAKRAIKENLGTEAIIKNWNDAA